MYRSLPVAALLVPTSLLASLAMPRPVEAKRAAPNIRGSYFGAFQSTGGDFWTADMTLTFQNTRQVSGLMNLSGIIRGAGVYGTFTPSQQFNITGQSPRGQRPFRVKLRGKATINEETGRVTLNGTYVITGSMREKGTFQLTGNTNGGPVL